MEAETAQAYADGYRYVLNQLSTGGGKTWLLASQVAQTDGPACTIVHRQELLSQISTTYAKAGIRHAITAPQPVVNGIIEQHVQELGRSFIDHRSQTVVAGVDTLIRRHKPSDRWCKSVVKWLCDEAHHMLGVGLPWDDANKWGRAAQLFPNAVGFGVTATPIRADRRSLHIEQGGAFDHLVQGVSMRELIADGSLCDYRVIAPEPSINEALLKIGSTGDFTSASQRAATRAELFGDIVRTYLERVPGKRAIVFTTGVEASQQLAEKFNDAGVRAKALDGNTDDGTRNRAVRAFSRGELDVLINTGLFDEGFDVPAVEVTIMARPTMSFGLFCQQIGRCLRPADGKEYGVVIDHVGNVLRMAATHGMPDTPRRWTLWKDESTRGVPKNPDAIPMRTCICGLAYPAISTACPFCGAAHEPTGRAAPEQVDGILTEMSPELLERLRMARASVEAEKPRVPIGADAATVRRLENLHRDRQSAHRSLAEVMQVWGGMRRAAGDDDTAMQARFFHRFGVDVFTAQTLKTADAIRLRDEIRETLI